MTTPRNEFNGIAMNDVEARLIKKIQTAIKTYEGFDPRSGGGSGGGIYRDEDAPTTPSTYFKAESKPVFLKLAHDLASLVAKQGAENTCAPLIAIARELQKASDLSWKTGHDFGYIFKRGLAATQKTNPFKKFDL